jgi:signal transduction histidine kinase
MSLRWWWPVALVGIAVGAAVAVLIATSDEVTSPVGTIVASLLVGWSFLGTGLFAWRLRPTNVVGPLMAASGLSWMVATLSMSDVPLAYSIGYLLGAMPIVLVVHLLLAYPNGVLDGRLARTVIALAYVDVVVGSVVLSLIQTTDRELDNDTRNLFAITDAPDLAATIDGIITVIGIALIIAAGYVLARRWVRAGPLQRRGLAPLIVTGGALLLFLIVTLSTDAFADASEARDTIWGVASIALLLVPYSYLIGLLGSGWSRAAAVTDVVRGLNQPQQGVRVRDAIAQALRDPDLEVVFKRRDRDEWVDGDGRRFALPPGRALTEIRRDGETTAGMVHRASLSDDPELLRAVGDAAALALENLRLEAELRARVTELQESRANIIAFGLAERRRLERDLHDGAQQRLVALSLQVNLARAKLEDDPATAATLLDSAREELRQALDELRELARGIHPAILTDQGLGPAVTALAQRSPVPVEVEQLPDGRLPSQVEAVAYFVVSEALANVVKYSHADHATVRVMRAEDRAVVEVRDDGVGGADARRGTGLRGLADRVGALDGQLRIQSPDGVGTVVRAELPCVLS